MYRFTDSSAAPIALPLPKISEEIMRSLCGSRTAFSCPNHPCGNPGQPRTQSRWMLQGPQGPQIPLPSHKPQGPRGPQVPLPSHKPPGAPGVIARSLIQGLPSAVSRIPPALRRSFIEIYFRICSRARKNLALVDSQGRRNSTSCPVFSKSCPMGHSPPFKAC